MTENNTPKNNKLSSKEIESGDMTENIAAVDGDLSGDASYQELLEYYQNAEWNQCIPLLDELISRYPDKPFLQELRADVDMKLVLSNMREEEAKSKRKKKIIRWVAIMGSLIIIFLGTIIFLKQATIKYQQEINAYQNQLKEAQLENIYLLESQARSSLQAGKPDAALEIITKIEELDPYYKPLESLRKEVDEQLALVNLYDQAMAAMSRQEYDDALGIFTQIYASNSYFRDVVYQIEWINNHKKVMRFIADGETAYSQKKWEDVITAYNEALTLDSSINSQKIKDQLLYGYLNSIIETLSQEEPTIEELERSGTYYRKAIALIPQNRDYIAERENLRILSRELLISKNYQTAKTILKDPNHSRATVAKAIKFLQTASELAPDDQVYKTELSKAELYQSALQYIDQTKMPQAIAVLEDLAKFDRGYPNGMGPNLLYEAYVINGLKLYRDGFYMDARINYENAELIAWENRDNKMQLFLVQINLGKTIGKLENYPDAVSYIEYALKTIDDTVQAIDDRVFNELLIRAKDLSSKKEYFEAYSAYLELLDQPDALFTFQDVYVNSGTTLIYLADQYQSTIEAIQLYNEVEFPMITRSQPVSIPTIP